MVGTLSDSDRNLQRAVSSMSKTEPSLCIFHARLDSGCHGGGSAIGSWKPPPSPANPRSAVSTRGDGEQNGARLLFAS